MSSTLHLLDFEPNGHAWSAKGALARLGAFDFFVAPWCFEGDQQRWVAIWTKQPWALSDLLDGEVTRMTHIEDSSTGFGCCVLMLEDVGMAAALLRRLLAQCSTRVAAA